MDFEDCPNVQVDFSYINFQRYLIWNMRPKLKHLRNYVKLVLEFSVVKINLHVIIYNPN